MGVLQHHDAVTGTAKQAVTFDYAQRLHAGFEACENVIAKALQKNVFPTSNPNEENHFEFCHLLNITQCAVTEDNSKFIVHAYNPLGRSVDRYIRLPVRKGSYEVVQLDQEAPYSMTIQSQLVPIPKPVFLIPGRNSRATHELVFKASKIPPMGNKMYHITKTKSGMTDEQQMSRKHLVSRIWQINCN